MYEGLRLSFGLALPARNTITGFDLFLVQKKKKTHKRIHQDSLSDIFMYVTYMCMSARPPQCNLIRIVATQAQHLPLLSPPSFPQDFLLLLDYFKRCELKASITFFTAVKQSTTNTARKM